MSAWWWKSSSASCSSIRRSSSSRATSPGACRARCCWRSRRRRPSRSLALLTYRGVSATERAARPRRCSSACALAALAVLLFCLFRPTLILKAAVPQQNFLGVLVDDSRSMSIADRDGQPRSAFVQQQLAGPNATLLDALSQRFVLRFFRFSSSADRVGVGRRPEVRRHVDAARPGARARARRARPACRSPAW